MHMKGHVDQWCKENCDANNAQELKGVLRGKRCGVNVVFFSIFLLVFFSIITISFLLGHQPEQNYCNPITY